MTKHTKAYWCFACGEESKIKITIKKTKIKYLCEACGSAFFQNPRTGTKLNVNLANLVPYEVFKNTEKRIEDISKQISDLVEDINEAKDNYL